MKNTIEMVCTMNEGRSPVAEFIGENYLLSRWISDYNIISSWSGRELSDSSELQSNADTNVSDEVLIAMIEQWRQQNIFNYMDLIDYKPWCDRTELEKLFLQANKIFKAQERHFRADAIHDLVEKNKMSGYLKADSHQTMVRDDVGLILCMANNNVEQVKRIYKGSSQSPIITTLSEYALNKEGSELKNAFGKWADFYHNIIDQIVVQVPQAIEKYINYSFK